jgi:UDP-N-acetylmuramoylalanine--D-glutamate ligase
MIINTQSAKEAVYVASKMSESGDAVLLSPACASFDLFENYEERGRLFKQAVKNL